MHQRVQAPQPQDAATELAQRRRDLSREFSTVISIETVEYGERRRSIGRVVIAS